jgi:ATP-dependent helicase HrpB
LRWYSISLIDFGLRGRGDYIRAMKLPDYPVLAALPALRAALRDPGCAVLAAPPGSGKTTTIPLALLDEPWLQQKKIVMLEPRRIAARAAASRMAQLLGEKVGERVGYQIRLERRTSAQTRIEVVTEGLLARRVQSDPDLPGVGLVICDEFHERSLDADLALALTLDARANLRPDLRVLVMSATLEITRVAKLLGDAPIVAAEGRLHPVDVRFTPMRADRHGEAVAQGILNAWPATQGDVLSFLPGGREIRDAQRVLESRLGSTARIFPLYGDLSSEAQDAALAPSRDGTRKVILATNIAQTSLTVEGVTTVVDGGLVRNARFDLGSGANRLETERVSRASADQRAGRAGRLGPGVCYRLWSKEQHGALPAHDAPEIASADLSRFALELAGWGVHDVSGLPFLDAPPAANWRYARELLLELGALDRDSRITAHGRELLRLPMAPRVAHMLMLARREGFASTAAWIAAALEQRAADGFDLATQLRSLVREQGRVREVVRQTLRILDERDVGTDESAIGRVVSWAFPERIARRRTNQSGVREASFLCEDGGEALISSHDPLAQSPWLAIAHWDPGPPRKIRLAATIDERDVMRDHADRVQEKRVVHWDAPLQAVVAEVQRALGSIVLERRPLRDVGEASVAAMLEGIRELGIGALPWDEAARQWQARVASLRRWRPTEDWPAVDDAALAESAETWLGPYLSGVTRRDHLSRLDLISILNSRLDHAGQQRLARLAPTHIGVPSGSRIALEYFADDRPPALSVKLQEMFGCTQTPAVNEGRTPVVVHLLSPAQRPLAVTQDLAGFWQRTYPEVRREMKGRYPRHPWPDDPLAAPPTRRAKPRGT